MPEESRKNARDGRNSGSSNSSNNNTAALRNNGSLDPSSFLVKVVIAITALVILYESAAVVLFGDKHLWVIFADLSINSAAIAALGVAIMVVARQKLSGLHGKTYAAFAVGLALWTAAELVQTYYEIGTGEDAEIPFPSAADALWLAGYGPFAYHLFATYKFFSRSAKPYMLAAVLATTAIAFGLIVQLIVFSGVSSGWMEQQGEEGEGEGGEENAASTVVNAAYPVLDAVLIVPSIMLLAILRKGKFASAPWSLLAASILVLAMADSAFGYASAVSPDSEVWGFSIFYFAGYLCMAGALLCHNRLFIFDRERAMRVWQEQNR